MNSPTQLQAPKGTRDFYPEDMRVQNHLFEVWRRACRDFNFEEYEGPTFEHLELFTEKSGQEIVTQLYNFKDKGDRDIALRPEMTPSLARMVNQKGNSLRLPLRWFSVPRLFRYEKAQRGRLREFFQLNMDIIGCDTIAGEVDLLSSIIEMLKAFGLTSSDFSIQVSSRRLLSEFLDGQGVPAEKKDPVYAGLDKRAKIGEGEFRNLLEKEGLAPVIIDSIEAFFKCKGLGDLKAWFPAAPELSAPAASPAAIPVGSTGPVSSPTALAPAVSKSGLWELEKLFEYMNSLGYGDFLNLDLSVVRGLAYYTGIVFEVYDKAIGLRAVAGGGRYDNLLSSLGGLPLSGVGFGMGDVVLAELLREKGLMPSGRQPLDYYLVDVTPNDSKLPNPELMILAQRLRSQGRRVGYALSGEKMKKQMAQANDQSARRVLFFGSDKATAGHFEIKDLGTGEQKSAAFDDL
ncbi:MAG: histidine--tRNA ligase [Fibrobacterota bacterium]|nr:histidine--tRNA ligase [Fibrobacterota bacterium]